MSTATRQSNFGSQSPFADLVEIAAACLFCLCRNHPFLDGNKRAGLGAAIVFLRLNRIETPPDSEAWKQLTLDVTASRIDREETTARLRRLLHKRK